MYNRKIENIRKLGFTWETADPFLFCVHHMDDYPAGNDQMGPAASLAGRNLGQDFTIKDGWRMYHGTRIPGFPTHPHRGFETVTIVLDGFVDHSDSHGATGRYGNGDVQWMTAGAGLQHAEMFPLLNQEGGNHLELFQIWLNLPPGKKFARPYYKMHWAEDIPRIVEKDHHGKYIELNIIAGKYRGVSALRPAPDSWAADKENEVAIWIVKMEANTHWTMPAASPDTDRSLYFYRGPSLTIAGLQLEPYHAVQLNADQDVIVESGDEDCFFLILQGKPINEPVAQHGPFVMNTHAEIQQAIDDYRKTQFGGWPWQEYDHVNPRLKGRFAQYADGKEETRGI